MIVLQLYGVPLKLRGGILYGLLSEFVAAKNILSAVFALKAICGFTIVRDFGHLIKKGNVELLVILVINEHVRLFKPIALAMPLHSDFESFAQPLD